MEQMQRTIHIQPRPKLRGLIIESGYQTVGGFSYAAQVDEVTARLVIEGKLIPSKKFIAKTAEACRTTRKKVVEALY